MRVRIRFPLYKAFDLGREDYVLEGVREDITLLDVLRELSKQLNAPSLAGSLSDGRGRGLMVFVDGTQVDDLGVTLREVARGREVVELVALPVLEGGAPGRPDGAAASPRRDQRRALARGTDDPRVYG